MKAGRPPSLGGSCPPADCIDAAVELALREDLSSEVLSPAADLTTSCLIDLAMSVTASILSRQDGVIAGVAIAKAVFHRLDDSVEFDAVHEDGDTVSGGEEMVRLRGPARPVLTGERTALNFLQHLSGIATLTRAYIDAVSGTGVEITDTRKTTPGIRLLEKYAVRCGGGVSHRLGLHDAVLIKENHIALSGGAAAAVSRARQLKGSNGSSATAVMIEAATLDEVRQLASLGTGQCPDRILLDNMSVLLMREAVELIRAADGKAIEIEATGGVDLGSVREVAETGVDLISVGALTHSAPALDITLLLDD